MAVVIDSVRPYSPAAFHRIKPGDKLLRINSNEINDVLDYRFYAGDRHITAEFETSDGKIRTVKFRNKNADDIGLEFSTYLMDKQRRCANNCVF